MNDHTYPTTPRRAVFQRLLYRALFIMTLTLLAPIVAAGPSSALAANVAPETFSAELNPAAATGSQQLRFLPSAVGTVARAADLVSAPVGGTVIDGLTAGSRVSIGGKVPVPAGILPRRAYYVRVDSPSGPLHGFLPERSVIVTAGVVPNLDVSGISAASMLNPLTGLDRAGDVIGSAAVLAEDPRPAASGQSASSTVVGIPQAGASYSVATGAVISWLPDTVQRWMPSIEAAAREHNVDPELVAIVILVESGGNPTAVSPSGAIGLMQIMPGTGLDIATRRGIVGFTTQQLTDPVTNIDFGAWYLREMLRSFGVPNDPDWQRSVETAAAAYNGGPGHVGQHLTTGQPLAAESSRYRAWVGGMWRERGLGSSITLAAWLDAGGQRLIDSARFVTVAY